MKYLDKSVRKFVALTSVLVLFSILMLGLFGYIYRYSTINTYNFILLIVIVLTIIITLLFILSAIAVFYTYRVRSVNRFLLKPVKLALKLLLPVVTVMSGIFKGSKDAVRNFYIDINNILVDSNRRKYSPGEILILLPHCLQHSSCSFKITNDIGNCKKCGKCCIGDIAEIGEQTGVKVLVATGGTAARNSIARLKPKLILSVACERDLASGIADVSRIPVIGVVNDRPNGPCYNTVVDVNKLREKLNTILKK
ncbi:MAG: DUF116 domain-containing protein [Clostridia bacterium]|nr:DUF116 domain-containing protein [Clostridia bacterium]